MAPFAQQGDSISDPGRSDPVSTLTRTGTSVSYSTKGSIPTPISSITTIPSTLSTATATPTYISKGSPTPTNSSLRGSEPPSTMAIQSSTLAFLLVVALLLAIALGILAWRNGWGYRKTGLVPLQPTKPTTLQRQDSNATLVDESSFRRQSRERTVTIEIGELRLQGVRSGRHGDRTAVQVPQKTLGGLAGS